MWIPGFGSDEIRPFKKACTTEAHKQVTSSPFCIRRVKIIQLFVVTDLTDRKTSHSLTLMFVFIFVSENGTDPQDNQKVARLTDTSYTHFFSFVFCQFVFH